jgi:hypothetical protein
MNDQRVGYSGYQLYRLGWQNSLHRNLSPLQHFLLSSLLYYRRGFEEAAQWRKNLSQLGLLS